MSRRLLLGCAIEHSAERAPFATVCAMAVSPQNEDYMLLIVGAVIALIAVAIVARVRVPGGVNDGTLGWMSEQWLAEHRASKSV